MKLFNETNKTSHLANARCFSGATIVAYFKRSQLNPLKLVAFRSSFNQIPEKTHFWTYLGYGCLYRRFGTGMEVNWPFLTLNQMESYENLIKMSKMQQKRWRIRETFKNTRIFEALIILLKILSTMRKYHPETSKISSRDTLLSHFHLFQILWTYFDELQKYLITINTGEFATHWSRLFEYFAIYGTESFRFFMHSKLFQQKKNIKCCYLNWPERPTALIYCNTYNMKRWKFWNSSQIIIESFYVVQHRIWNGLWNE